jgi:hypothetical protein
MSSPDTPGPRDIPFTPAPRKPQDLSRPFDGLNGEFASTSAPSFDVPGERTHFVNAMLFGGLAALAGSLGWGIVSLSGWMVSIVAIGIGWLVARAMMTATGGVGGRQYQIAAAIMTYFACTFGPLIGALLRAQLHGEWDILRAGSGLLPFMLEVVTIGPFLRLQSSPFNGILGLAILFYGVSRAWQLAAGSPGFGSNRRQNGF